MVYESDFYTTRRPYSSRVTPSITSYSVTTDIEPTSVKAPPFQRTLPFVAHKRLTAPQAPPPRSKLRNSVLMAEIDRINHRYQLMRKLNYRIDPSEPPSYSPTRSPSVSTRREEALDSDPYWKLRNRVKKGELPLCAIATYDIYRLEMFFHDLNFDDETRSIRAQTAALLKRVHSPIPRSRGPLHVVLPTPSSLMETPVPHRHTSDHYIEGLLAPINKVQRDVVSRSFYVEHPRPYIGKGNLACVSFAGGRSYAKRRAHYDVPEDHHNVQDDIATLSYYNRARAVANGQEPGPEPAATTTRKSRPYRSTTDSAPAPKAEPVVASSPASRPSAAPVRQASVQEDPVAEAAAEAELAAEAEPITNGVHDDEAARLAAEEAELERQLEEELRAEMEAKEAKKAKKAAAKKAAEEAEARRQADEAAQKAAEEEAAAAAAAEAEAAAEAARKAAEEEAELERLVAAELEAERQAAEAKKAEEEKAAEEAAAEAAAAEEQAVSSEQETSEAEIKVEDDVEPEVEADAAVEEADPEPEPSPESEPADEPEPIAAEPEAEAEIEVAASPEPEAIAEDDPVVEEPASEAQVEEAKSDEDAGWPLDDE